MAEGSYPPELGYHPGHGWARVEGDTATFGITWFAQDQLGEVVFFDPPDPGAEVAAGSSYAEVESLKAVSEVLAPLGGEVIEVNSELGASPEKINDDPYGEGWLVKVRLAAPPGEGELLDAAAYQATLS
ncbi:MAG: glycine cleavage system protein GcvH [Acidobacteria bacterium]|nr:glycine cleavage system protein GcvH [Acidobacteriota bacterium]